jgi:hypothetical protein
VILTYPYFNLREKKMAKTTKNSIETINPLRNEKVIVRFVPRDNDNIADRKHVAFGGMMDNSVRGFTVPMLSNGVYRNVLTDNEKNYLEDVLGLEINGLSVYNKKDNFWDDYLIKLTKQDTILDLSIPEDYIKYKVLLANKDTVAPSMSDLKRAKKATYEYVIMEPNEEFADSRNRVNNTMKCYEEFGAIKDKFDVLKCIIETIDGRPVANNTKIEFLQAKVTDLITANPKLFLETITDPLLATKVIIKKAVERNVISKRGEYYYLREDGSPMCGPNEDPTFTIAAKYLSLPENQELKFSIEAKINN